MIWTDDSGTTWYGCIPSGVGQYNSQTLGPFGSKEEATAAVDVAWGNRDHQHKERTT